MQYSIVEYPAVETTALADEFIEGYEGVRTKSLFLVNRKKNRSYLVIMDGSKELDLDSLAEQFGESRLSFGSPERLQPALGLEPGIVSPFEMLDPDPREVKLCFDDVMLTERVLTFHPGDNRGRCLLRRMHSSRRSRRRRSPTSGSTLSDGPDRRGRVKTEKSNVGGPS